MYSLTASRVEKSQLIAKRREANLLKLDQVRAAILKSTGDISVLHPSENSDIELEKELLTGVRKKL